jgi:hypothetical protein
VRSGARPLMSRIAVHPLRGLSPMCPYSRMRAPQTRPLTHFPSNGATSVPLTPAIRS